MNKLFNLLIISVVLLQSCQLPDVIRGNGNEVSEMRAIAKVDRVELQINAEVYITNEHSDSVKLRAESNILNEIVLENNGGKLVIKQKVGSILKENEPIRIYIGTSSLSAMEVSGSGYMECDTIYVDDNSEITVSGSGKIKTKQVYGSNLRAEIRGSGELSIDSIDVIKFTTDVSGSGKINAKYANCAESRLEISGSGKTTLNVFCNQIKTTISGSGDVNLNGSAGISEINISGSGKYNAYNCYSDTCYATISGSGDVMVDVSSLLDVSISASGSVIYEGNPELNYKISGSGNVSKR
ncbi:MAG: DUF2807 domain-containing protein [Bacteroidales bacterium]|nr:DUF2807 domain-containing protein [Bacteroidales bacterium]